MLPRVALHHGIFGYDELKLGPLRISQFPGVPKALTEAGYPTIQTRVHPVASIARRAAQLRESILKQIGDSDDRIILVAHSLGGLDARYMLSHLDMAGRVSALLTISTPHRGASLADFCHLNLGRRLKMYRLISTCIDIGAAYDLTRESMARFNEAVPDHPDVRYFSITCSAAWPEAGAKYLVSHRIITRAEGENDGVVAVSSARWGTHLEHWPVDHIASVNRRRLRNWQDVAPRYVSAVAKVREHLGAPLTRTGSVG